jgi:hypothetical protein
MDRRSQPISDQSRSNSMRLNSRTVVAFAGALALSGCMSVTAHPDFLKTGMTRAQLDSQFGKPAAERRDGGDDVLIYTAQPLGQRASAAHVASDGRVTAVEPLLNTEHFALIAVNDWNENAVFTHFGPPAEVRHTRQYLVWSYRYKEAQVWDSLFSVMFDESGTVRVTQNGPDPMYNREGKDGGK